MSPKNKGYKDEDKKSKNSLAEDEDRSVTEKNSEKKSVESVENGSDVEISTLKENENTEENLQDARKSSREESVHTNISRHADSVTSNGDSIFLGSSAELKGKKVVKKVLCRNISASRDESNSSGTIEGDENENNCNINNDNEKGVSSKRSSLLNKNGSSILDFSIMSSSKRMSFANQTNGEESSLDSGNNICSEENIDKKDFNTSADNGSELNDYSRAQSSVHQSKNTSKSNNIIQSEADAVSANVNDDEVENKTRSDIKEKLVVKFYKRHHVPLYMYITPIFLPLSYKICIFYVVVMFLLTHWFLKIKLMFCFKECDFKNSSHIYFNTLCEIFCVNGVYYFDYLKCIYVIEDLEGNRNVRKVPGKDASESRRQGDVNLTESKDNNNVVEKSSIVRRDGKGTVLSKIEKDHTAILDESMEDTALYSHISNKHYKNSYTGFSSTNISNFSPEENNLCDNELSISISETCIKKSIFNEQNSSLTNMNEKKNENVYSDVSGRFGIYKLVPCLNKPIIEYLRFQAISPQKYIELSIKNELKPPSPTFFTLLYGNLLSPFFIFQLFSNLLWCYDEYFYHGLISIGMQFLFEFSVVFARLKSLQIFGNVDIKKCQAILLYRDLKCSKASMKGTSDVKISKSHLDLQNRYNAVNGVDNKNIIVDSSTTKKSNIAETFEMTQIMSTDVVPGDIIVLNSSGLQIPCDMLILHGSCAVNEAMLTGESIPLHKEDISERNYDDVFDLEHDKRHVLFGGTTLLKINPVLSDFPEYSERKYLNKCGGNMEHIPPNKCIDKTSLCNGSSSRINDINANEEKELHRICSKNTKSIYVSKILKVDASTQTDTSIFNFNKDELSQFIDIESPYIICYVLQTSFNTQQGMLIQKMISTDQVTIENKEAYLFILCLLVFALASGIYVVYDYYANEKYKTKPGNKLILELIMLLTNVVPSELPMELTLAVNNALQNLMKSGIFCLEPFRIPLAGNVDVCCFDKTGTLTEANLTVHNVLYKSGKSILGCNISELGNSNNEVPKKNVEDLTLAISICHSLVKMNTILGDPMEVSIYDYYKIGLINDTVSIIGNKSTHIIKKWSFTSELRRMTAVGEIQEFKDPIDPNIFNISNVNDDKTHQNKINHNQIMYISSMKGAPEVVMRYLKSVPHNYGLYKKFAKQGFRVISVAYKKIEASNIPINASKNKSESNNIHNTDVSILKPKNKKKTFKKNETEEKRNHIYNNITREFAESDLEFLGFIVYECKIKKDTVETIKELKDSGHGVVMITGDNLLTAMAVAKKVGIIDNGSIDDQDDIVDDDNKENFDYKKDNNSEEENIKITKRKNLEHSSETNTYRNKNIAVNNTFKSYNSSLNLNANSPVHRIKEGLEGKAIDDVLNSDDFYNIKVFARANPIQKENIIKKYKKTKTVLMCGDGTNDVGALKTAHIGVALVEAPKLKPKKRKTQQTTEEINQARKKRFQSMIAAEELEERRVKLGDASVAAPFTTKTTLKSITNIIKQGRSTLVTTTQMHKILALNCIITAFSLSILDIKGIKYGDTQMIISGILIAFAFMFVTRSKINDVICKKKPLNSVFCNYVVFSIILQTVVHIASFYVLLGGVKDVAYENIGFGTKSGFFDSKYSDVLIKIDPSKIVSDTTETKNSNIITTKNSLTNKDSDATDKNKTDKVDEKSKFRPSTLNSSIFLLSISQQISTFTINYIGQPYRESLLDNRNLRNSLTAVSIILVSLILELNTNFSRLMEIVPLGECKNFLFSVVVADFVLSYICEKICFRIFMI
ncbi:HAD ATPase, P-type, family IC [Edhazardia aedis USNM 41457]|uniref:HAD ATPase, P-type, family IC n=1 Tax=Edhazardia aedis (strain USNM 41457) TaxID=1003232 RepID=J9A075_EDHAE|nr:HAD ATPase, P-type, family IC [Edhazardia aedis USNM 41457]|eukprot:EJW05308.1 HAD ATPase, P-type, family IC [Edhazardia aedis USNM 41457]